MAMPMAVTPVEAQVVERVKRMEVEMRVVAMAEEMVTSMAEEGEASGETEAVRKAAGPATAAAARDAAGKAGEEAFEEGLPVHLGERTAVAVEATWAASVVDATAGRWEVASEAIVAVTEAVVAGKPEGAWASAAIVAVVGAEAEAAPRAAETAAPTEWGTGTVAAEGAGALVPATGVADTRAMVVAVAMVAVAMGARAGTFHT